MNKIVTVNEINRDQWHKLVLNSSKATFFQTAECYDFYCSLSFLDGFVYGVTENEELVGLICGYITSDKNRVKQLFTRRAIVPGGVLVSDSITESALMHLLSHATDLLSIKAIYIEIRNYHDYSSFQSSFEKKGFLYNFHLNFQIEFDSNKRQFEKLSESKKRQLNVAIKNGVSYETTTDENEIVAFYSILKKLYQTKIKLPLFPIEFFHKLVKLDHAKIIVLKHNQKIIGGIVCVILQTKCMYEWFVCADDTVNKKLYPSVLATWAGINYAENLRLKRFDFMGAGKPDKDYGVREFKSKFGGQQVEHGRFLYICNPFRYTLGKFIINLIRK